MNNNTITNQPVDLSSKNSSSSGKSSGSSSNSSSSDDNKEGKKDDDCPPGMVDSSDGGDGNAGRADEENPNMTVSPSWRHLCLFQRSPLLGDENQGGADPRLVQSGL